MVKEIEDRRVRATRRAAIGRSLARLVRRGLLESCSRGYWQPSKRGLRVARQVFPEIRPLTRLELAQKIAREKMIRLPGHRRSKLQAHRLNVMKSNGVNKPNLSENIENLQEQEVRAC
jgi:hypothetical protein